MQIDDLKNKDSIIAIIGIIFFIILAIIARKTTMQTQEQPQATPTPSPIATEETIPQKDILESLKNKNYHFTYTIVEGEKTEIIDGKVNGNKMKFTIIGDQREEYAKISDSYLKLIKGNYQITTSQIRFYFPYLQIQTIEEVLKQSTQKKKENILYYTVDTIDLLDQYTEIEYTGFEERRDNQIKIITTDDGKIERIEIDYSNYYFYLNNVEKTFKITMELNQYDMIEELEI